MAVRGAGSVPSPETLSREAGTRRGYARPRGTRRPQPRHPPRRPRPGPARAGRAGGGAAHADLDVPRGRRRATPASATRRGTPSRRPSGRLEGGRRPRVRLRHGRHLGRASPSSPAAARRRAARRGLQRHRRHPRRPLRGREVVVSQVDVTDTDGLVAAPRRCRDALARVADQPAAGRRRARGARRRGPRARRPRRRRQHLRHSPAPAAARRSAPTSSCTR